jgi:hypothetical protein
VAALGLLASIILFVFRGAILHGMVMYEKDTQLFYYPLLSWFAGEFKAGSFPLWNPNIFAGYPIFADGEMGLAYPIQLLLLAVLPVPDAFIWLRISSVLIAAGGAYALCRALRLDRLPAFLGGLTFSLGSFFVSQQHHEDVTRTAAWLPLVLACAEWGFRTRGWRRHLFFTSAGLALACSALGLHPQFLGMSCLAYAWYVIARVLFGPFDASRATPRRGWRRLQGLPAWLGGRTGLLIWAGGYVGLLGLGLAAVQVLPTGELAAATFRGSAPDYAFSTSYALPMQNLAMLLFPYFFRGPDSSHWSLWAYWETTIYVGIAPLILGLIGIGFARRREVLVFLLLGAVALWLAFASYAPFDLYHVLWDLPGFSGFRVPGRYMYLFVLAWSVLAAFGMQAISTRATAAWLRRIGIAGAVVLLGAAFLVLIWGMAHLRASLLVDPGGALAWIDSAYLSFRHTPEGISRDVVYQDLLFSLDRHTARTMLTLILVPSALVLVLAAALLRRWTSLWLTALVAITMVDLVAFDGAFHPQTSVDQLSTATGAIDFLANASRGNAEPWRVYTPGTIASVEFNRLVPFGIEEIGGYSSIEPRRNFEYWTLGGAGAGPLLSLANVGYVVQPAQPVSLPSYAHVPYDPEQPLILASAGSIGDGGAYATEGARANRVQVLAALTKAIDVPQGTVVAEINVVPRVGERVVIPLRAGIDVAEWAYDRPDVRGLVKHEKPATIAFQRDEPFIDGKSYPQYVFYNEHDFPDAMNVERLEVRYIYPIGGIEVYGLGLFDFETGQTAGLTFVDRSNLHAVYADGDVRVFANDAAFPRGYVVPSARLVPDGRGVLGAMLDQPFDPGRQVMLSELTAEERSRLTNVVSGPEGPPTGPPLPAERIVAEADRVVFRASAPPGGGYLVNVADYFPGWRARVDGNDAPIYLANGLFRAVPLPPGDHTVEFWYDPPAVDIGLGITLWTAAMAATPLLGVSYLALRRRGQRRSARAPHVSIANAAQPADVDVSDLARNDRTRSSMGLRS